MSDIRDMAIIDASKLRLLVAAFSFLHQQDLIMLCLMDWFMSEGTLVICSCGTSHATPPAKVEPVAVRDRHQS